MSEDLFHDYSNMSDAKKKQAHEIQGRRNEKWIAGKEEKRWVVNIRKIARRVLTSKHV